MESHVWILFRIIGREIGISTELVTRQLTIRFDNMRRDNTVMFLYSWLFYLWKSNSWVNDNHPLGYAPFLKIGIPLLQFFTYFVHSMIVWEVFWILHRLRMVRMVLLSKCTQLYLLYTKNRGTCPQTHIKHLHINNTCPDRYHLWGSSHVHGYKRGTGFSSYTHNV